MKDINMEEAKIKVDGKWFTSEEIAGEIQRKIQAGDMKIADYAAALEKLTTTMENSHLIEVKLVITKSEYNKLRELGKGDDRECIRKAIQAFIGKKIPPNKKSLEEKYSKSSGFFLEKTDADKTVVKCIKCKSPIEIPAETAPDDVRCLRCGEEESIEILEDQIKYTDHFLG